MGITGFPDDVTWEQYDRYSGDYISKIREFNETLKIEYLKARTSWELFYMLSLDEDEIDQIVELCSNNEGFIVDYLVREFKEELFEMIDD